MQKPKCLPRKRMPVHVVPGAQSACVPHVRVSPAAHVPIRHAVECALALAKY